MTGSPIRTLGLMAALAASVAPGCSSEPHRADAEAQPEDAAVGPSEAATECAPISNARELFVFDNNGPTDLIGGFEGTREFAGTVTRQSQGFPVDAAPSSAETPEHPENFRFLRVQAAEHSWTVALRDVESFGVQDGADVVLELRYRFGQFSATLGALAIRVDGQLAFAYTLGGKVESLMPPTELFIGQGAVICTQQSTCGAWSKYAILVHDTYAGVTEELAPGEQKPVGDYTVRVGDNRQQLSPESACPDWFVSRAQLIAYRSEPLARAR